MSNHPDTCDSRYLCLFVILDTMPGTPSPASHEHEYIMSLSMSQDGHRHTRHHVQLPHASFNILLRWNFARMTPEVRIRGFRESPGHRHGILLLYHNQVNLECPGPCAGLCIGRSRWRGGGDLVNLMGMHLRPVQEREPVVVE